MRQLIERARNLLYSTPDTVCLERARLATEGYTLFDGEPAPVKRAKTFAHILENMTRDLESNPVFAGNTSSRVRAWMLVPEHGFHVPDQAIVEDERLDGFLDGDVIPGDLRSFWDGRSLGGGSGVGHLAVDLPRVLSVGLEGIIDEIDGCSGPDEAADQYRQAMAIACRAVIRWAERYAEEARRVADTHKDKQVQNALRRVAEACRQVPRRPARTLFEALQSVVLVHLAIHIEGHGYSVAPGLLDRILLPYYAGDDDTTDLLAAFMLKLTANSVFGSHSKTQTITLGGLGSQGNDMCNPLTRHFLDACDIIRVPDPHVFLRWHEKCDPRIKRRAIELLGSGASMPMLIGDGQTVAGFIRAGIPSEDAWNYCVIGCNELGIPGKLADSAAGPTLNDAQVLNDALLSIDSPKRVTDMHDLLAVVRRKMREHLVPAATNGAAHRRMLADRAPTPFTSALMRTCIERGRDMHTDMQYSFPAIYERGFTNAVNGLAAIEHTVFERKTVKLGQAIDGIRTDFADETVRAKLLNAPKWGNDDARADAWAQVWMEMRQELISAIERELGTRPHVFVHVIRSLHHVDGRRMGATPDGRLAGSPLCDSIGAQAGTASEGPTALLNSVLKLKPAEYWQGGYNLNLTMPSRTALDEYTREKLIAMTEAFFANGGQELQIGCLDAGQLRDAKEHPDSYPNLLVRIAGFNALFSRLSPAEQDELIARAESA